MKLLFWSAKRLVPLYLLLGFSLLALGGIESLLGYVRAPDWAGTALIMIWATFVVGVMARGIVLQARDNRARPANWLDRDGPSSRDR